MGQLRELFVSFMRAILKIEDAVWVAIRQLQRIRYLVEEESGRGNF